MNSLAEPEHLFQRLGVDSPTPQARTRAEALLDDVADQVFRFTRQTFLFEENDQAVVNGSGSNLLLLPQIPVVDVTQVVELGTVLDPSTYDWSSDGRLVRRNGWWSNRLRAYEVIYSHGFATIPPALTGMVVRIAARGWINPTGLTQETAGGWTGAYGFDATRFPALAPADEDALRDWMPR